MFMLPRFLQQSFLRIVLVVYVSGKDGDTFQHSYQSKDLPREADSRGRNRQEKEAPFHSRLCSVQRTQGKLKLQLVFMAHLTVLEHRSNVMRQNPHACSAGQEETRRSRALDMQSPLDSSNGMNQQRQPFRMDHRNRKQQTPSVLNWQYLLMMFLTLHFLT